ncbi:hypothetical protein KC799_12990, partial [candidate division KSB1 bacterium]|nr:hypothetical protein [candidate division KSB1 bacterium]
NRVRAAGNDEIVARNESAPPEMMKLLQEIESGQPEVPCCNKKSSPASRKSVLAAKKRAGQPEYTMRKSFSSSS